MRVDVTLVGQLAAPTGQALLAGLPPYDEAHVIAVAARLRAQGHPPDLVAALLTQSRLRSRAAGKLGDRAHRMLFTPDGLEQATRAQVSPRHTRRFVDAGLTRVLDLGCGIGGDAWALAEAGLEVTAVEADEVTAAVARANLAEHPAAQVLTARAEEVPLPDAPDGATGGWLDPARRAPGVSDARGRTRRLFRLSQVSPSWEFVQHVATVVGSVGAKFGPGFPHDQIPVGVEAEWVSYGGEALECGLWWGDLREGAGGRRVAVHDGATWHTLGAARTTPGVPDSGRRRRSQDPGDGLPVEQGSWVLDPDRALLAAGLLEELCAVVGGHEIAPGTGYVVAPEAVRTPFARSLQVLQVLPLRTRTLRAWAREHDIGPLTVKKRGAGVNPEALRRQVAPRGTREATLLVTRAGAGSDAPVVGLWVSDPSRDGSP